MPDGYPTLFGSFPVPNALVDALLPSLKDTELRVLLVVMRQTWGWTDPKTGRPKARDWLTHGRLKRATGRASEAVSAAVDGLVRRDLLVVEDAAGRTLATPAERRRLAAALYFRPGSQLAGATAPINDTPGRKIETLKTEIRKAKTTKDKQDNTHFSFRISGHASGHNLNAEAENQPDAIKDRSETALTPDQIAHIEETRRQIRSRLASISRSGRR